MQQLSWAEWYEQVVEIYKEPVVTYDGLVYLCGNPPAGAKKACSPPSPEEVQSFRDNAIVVNMYRTLYEQGKTPREAIYDMW